MRINIEENVNANKKITVKKMVSPASDNAEILMVKIVKIKNFKIF